MPLIAKYAVILVLLVIGEMVYFRIARHFKIMDKPNERSSHKNVVLRGGGVVFFLGAWLWAAFWGLEYPWFMAGLTVIAIVSFLDDVAPLPDSVRLVFQFTAMCLMIIQMEFFHLDVWAVVLLVIVVGVGIVNCFNFMDGINGITGAYSLSVLLPLIYMNYSHDGGFVSMDLLLVVTVSVLVFCFFNFRRQARCFAGDVGAVSMAFILIFAIGLLVMRKKDITYIMFLAVYGVDTVLTIIHRIILGENIGKAHRKHAYQIMANELKMPHLLVSVLYFALQILISAGLIFIPVNHYIYSGIVLLVLCVAYVLFMKKYYHLHSEYLETLNNE